jgi:hypothetical protein
MDKGILTFAGSVFLIFLFLLVDLERHSARTEAEETSHTQQLIAQDEQLFKQALHEWSAEAERSNVHLVSPEIVQGCSGIVQRYHIDAHGQNEILRSPKTIIFVNFPKDEASPEIITAELSGYDSSRVVTGPFLAGFGLDSRSLVPQLIQTKPLIANNRIAGEHGSLQALLVNDARLGTRKYQNLLEDAAEICLNMDNDPEHLQKDIADFQSEIENTASMFISIDAALPNDEATVKLFYELSGNVQEKDFPLALTRSL